MSAVRKQVLDEILRRLRHDISWATDGTGGTRIVPEAIVFQKLTGERDINAGHTMDRLPGAFVSMPYREPFPETAGENAHDEYHWRFLVQIVDSDGYGQSDNIGTYLLWQENVCRAFQFLRLRQVDSVHALTNATAVNVVDEKYWVKEENFKTGIEIRARVWLTRCGYT